MEPLHAPWRIAYIRGPKPAAATAHLFKEIAESSDDEGNYVVARDRTCYAVLNRYPYTGGHLLVVPYKVSPDLDGLTEEELCDLFLLTRR
jgi:ATP adenylyltransferase